MQESAELLLVLVTIDSVFSAEELASTLVSERLCACVNVIPSVSSIYTWQGELRKDMEALMLIKTTSEVYDLLEDKIRALHPYDVPEIIAIRLDRGNESYLNWVMESVAGD